MNTKSSPLFNIGFLLFWLAFIGFSFFFYSCEQTKNLFTPDPPELTPWETYNAALDSTGLGDSQLAVKWRKAADGALKDSILIESPFRETGYFRADKPSALGYRLELKLGEVVNMNFEVSPDSTLLFVDLFREIMIDSIWTLEPVFHAEEYQTDSLTYEAEEEGMYVLRIQPELLAGCRYTFDLVVQPTYSFFPVSGKGNRDVWSFFGDPRDAGRRTHKGIDIFARRGTPVVAAVDGRVRRVRNTGLGGKQVWLSDTLRNQSLYYAHLDSQYVAEGIWVTAGDTLGTVGNTGNARTTSPHLHFSIYRRGRGAIDPHPFVARQADAVPTFMGDTTLIGRLMRVRKNRASLREGPDGRSQTIRRLDRHLPIEVIAATKGWYRVVTPEGKQGYLFGRSLESMDRPLKRLAVKEPTELLQEPGKEAIAVNMIQAEEEVVVLGRNEKYELVEKNEGQRGWILRSE